MKLDLFMFTKSSLWPSHSILTSASSSPALSRAALRAPSVMLSCVQLRAPSVTPSCMQSGVLSVALSCAQSRAPSIAPSHMQSNAPSPEPPLLVPPSPQDLCSLGLEISQLPRQSPCEIECACMSRSDDDTESSSDKSVGGGSNVEEEDDVQFLDDKETEQEPREKEEIQGWPELREQITADQKMVHKQNVTPTSINQLMILQNFAMLRIKGLGRMAASKEIVQQWHDGKGIHFACQVWMLAHHY